MTTLQTELNNEFVGKTVTITPSADNKQWTIKVDNVEETVPAGKDTTPQVASLPTGAGTKPYLPSGFKQLDGTDLSTGLVITDAINDIAKGNEYVWVEVPNANLGGTPTYGPDYSAQDLTATEITDETIDTNKDKIEAALWAYAGALIARTGTDSKTTAMGWKDEYYSGCGIANEETYNTKYKNMLKSVYNHGGFWVGRYEAGIDGSDEDNALARQSHTDISSTSPNAVSKMDCIPYNWVYCSEAQQLAERVGSNLMFGLQWDLTLRYLQATNAVDQTGLTSNSEGWGNYNYEYNLSQTTSHGYKGELLPFNGDKTISWSAIDSSFRHTKGSSPSNPFYTLSTGATERNSRKNIYDLAGNMEEWTLEKSNYQAYGYEYPCVHRGGWFSQTGSYCPVSWRNTNGTNNSEYYVGFRLSLY